MLVWHDFWPPTPQKTRCVVSAADKESKMIISALPSKGRGEKCYFSRHRKTSQGSLLLAFEHKGKRRGACCSEEQTEVKRTVTNVRNAPISKFKISRKLKGINVTLPQSKCMKVIVQSCQQQRLPMRRKCLILFPFPVKSSSNVTIENNVADCL